MKIFLIEDDPQTRFSIKLYFLEAFSEIEENEFKRPEDRMKFAEDKVAGKVVFLEEKDCSGVQKRYKEGFFDVIILDGNLLDGKTINLFELFKNEKRKVIAHSGDIFFLTQAAKFGFRSVLKEFPFSTLVSECKEILVL